jgi:hypothetical protein
MIQRLREVGLPQSRPGAEASGPVRGEYPVTLGGQEPDEFDTDRGLLYLLYSVNRIFSNVS